MENKAPRLRRQMLHLDGIQNRLRADVPHDCPGFNLNSMFLSPVARPDIGTLPGAADRADIARSFTVRMIDPKAGGIYKEVTRRWIQRICQSELKAVGIRRPLHGEGGKMVFIGIKVFLRHGNGDLHTGKPVMPLHQVSPQVTNMMVLPVSEKWLAMICRTSPAFMPPSRRTR